MRLDLLLLNKSLTESARAELLLQKEMHLDASKGQRRAMSEFIQLFVSKEAPDQVLPAVIFEEELEITRMMGSLVLEESPTVQVTAEDFGRSLTMPHYMGTDALLLIILKVI